MLRQTILTIQTLLLSIQIKWMTFDDCNPSKTRKNLVVFDDMIADIMSNIKFQSIIKELFIRCRKLNI